jgi:hypothetical protein
MLQSQVCRYEDLTTPEFQYWRNELSPYHPLPESGSKILVHRKMWEWLYTLEALNERGMLQEGRSGIGFGVGKEPLVALFAARGCSILATDLDPVQAKANGWLDSGVEYANDLSDLNAYGLCDDELFNKRVTYEHIDMNHLPARAQQYDFSWSSCAFEHLGNLVAGTEFVRNQMRFVRPGGVSVHTTELNVSSNLRTVTNGGTVLYRRRDIEKLAKQLTRSGYEIQLDLTVGSAPEDVHIDAPPFESGTHLKVALGGFVTTSVALVIEKPLSWSE